jgi:hypothetical protein
LRTYRICFFLDHASIKITRMEDSHA